MPGSLLFVRSQGQLNVNCHKANGLSPAKVAAAKGNILGLMKLKDLGASMAGIESSSSAALKQSLWKAVRDGNVETVRGAKTLQLLTRANCRNHQVKVDVPSHYSLRSGAFTCSR